MDGFGLEESSQLGVLMDDIAQVHFIDFGVSSLVSDAGPEEHPGEDSQGLESRC